MKQCETASACRYPLNAELAPIVESRTNIERTQGLVCGLLLLKRNANGRAKLTSRTPCLPNIDTMIQTMDMHHSATQPSHTNARTPQVPPAPPLALTVLGLPPPTTDKRLSPRRLRTLREAATTTRDKHIRSTQETRILKFLPPPFFCALLPLRVIFVGLLMVFITDSDVGRCGLAVGDEAPLLLSSRRFLPIRMRIGLWLPQALPQRHNAERTGMECRKMGHLSRHRHTEQQTQEAPRKEQSPGSHLLDVCLFACVFLCLFHEHVHMSAGCPKRLGDLLVSPCRRQPASQQGKVPLRSGPFRCITCVVSR